VAACRTFVFLSELEPLLRLNLIKGGDLDNAIVIVDKESTQEEFDRLAELFNKPSVTVQSSGVLNNLKLQFPNEPARHKLLDIIGDLALVGYRFNGSVLARRPGHFGNTEMAKLIRKQIQKKHNKLTDNNIPVYEHDVKPLLDINKIKAFLPHRYPFLFVDKIMSLTDKEIVGIKNLSNDEYYFEGHFPNRPVMPEVLQLEAMIQTGTILILNSTSNPSHYSVEFLQIFDAKFYRNVVPGDVLVVKLSLSGPVEDGNACLHGKAFVGTELVCEAEMNAKIVKATSYEDLVKNSEVICSATKITANGNTTNAKAIQTITIW
jgi:UDP-3-O-[3-hydroxymyristoyl] N-acetylglucosamine deacetylase/3-hydroxyacyl-[acyl-carrier-protein] dehydratase